MNRNLISTKYGPCYDRFWTLLCYSHTIVGIHRRVRIVACPGPGRDGVGRMVKQDRAKLIQDLQREIQLRALQLSDLEVIIEDYQQERARLLDELKTLKEGLWDLTADGANNDTKVVVDQASVAAA